MSIPSHRMASGSSTISTSFTSAVIAPTLCLVDVLVLVEVGIVKVDKLEGILACSRVV